MRRVVTLGLALVVTAATGFILGYLVGESDRPERAPLWNQKSPAQEVATLYPRGYFSWCPNVPGTVQLDSGAADEAEQVAIRFSRRS